MATLPANSAEKELWRTQRADVRRILLREWDPIGVKDVPEPSDEYDHYADHVCAMARAGEDREDILKYLQWVRGDHMCLSLDRSTDEHVVDRILSVDWSERSQ